MKKAILFVVFFIIGFLAYEFLTSSGSGPTTTGSGTTVSTPKSSFTNAAEAYKQAEDLIQAKAAQLGAGLPGSVKDPQLQEAMELVLDGSHAPEADYSTIYPVTMKFDAAIPNFLTVQIMGKALVAQAQEYRKQDNLDEALVYANACLKYGQDMEDEGYTTIQYLIGLALKKMAYQELATIHQARGENDLAGQMKAGIESCDDGRDMASQFGEKLGNAGKAFDFKAMLDIYNNAPLPQSRLEGLTMIGELFMPKLNPEILKSLKQADIDKFNKQKPELELVAREFVKKCLNDEDKKVRNGAKIVSDRLGWSL